PSTSGPSSRCISSVSSTGGSDEPRTPRNSARKRPRSTGTGLKVGALAVWERRHRRARRPEPAPCWARNVHSFLAMLAALLLESFGCWPAPATGDGRGRGSRLESFGGAPNIASADAPALSPPREGEVRRRNFDDATSGEALSPPNEGGARGGSGQA